MNPGFKRFFLPLIAMLAVYSSCCDPEPEPNGCSDNSNCSNGFVCINGKCDCPDDGIVYHNHCIQMTDADQVFYGVNADCLCYDTLIIGINGNAPVRNISIPVKAGNLLGSAVSNVEYFTLASGDSIHANRLPVVCKDGSTSTQPEVFGKMQSDGSLKLRLVFYDAFTGELRDECTTVLQRKK